MTASKYFPLAAMTWPIRIFTIVLLCVPALMLVCGPVPVAWVLIVLYAVVWFWLRPKGFQITDQGLVIRWVLREKPVGRELIKNVRLIDEHNFREQYGWGIRIGAGGLWGGFGLLKTKQTTFEMYISGVADLVIVELHEGRDLLLSPSNADDFVRNSLGDFLAAEQEK